MYIFEFKLDGAAAEVLQQIEEKGYARPYEADARQVVKVGVMQIEVNEDQATQSCYILFHLGTAFFTRSPLFIDYQLVKGEW